MMEEQTLTVTVAYGNLLFCCPLSQPSDGVHTRIHTNTNLIPHRVCPLAAAAAANAALVVLFLITHFQQVILIPALQ